MTWPSSSLPSHILFLPFLPTHGYVRVLRLILMTECCEASCCLLFPHALLPDLSLNSHLPPRYKASPPPPTTTTAAIIQTQIYELFHFLEEPRVHASDCLGRDKWRTRVITEETDVNCLFAGHVL